MTLLLEQPNLSHNSHNYSYTSLGIETAKQNSNKNTKDLQKSSRLRDTEVDGKSIQSIKGVFLQLLV